MRGAALHILVIGAAVYWVTAKPLVSANNVDPFSRMGMQAEDREIAHKWYFCASALDATTLPSKSNQSLDAALQK